MINAFTINEINVSYSLKIKNSERPQIDCSKNVYELILPLWHDIDLLESFKVLLLSKGNRVLGLANLFRGGLSGVAADPKQIFQVALKCNAAHIILMHNHPSGNLKASSADRSITNKLKQAGEFLDLPILDHMIFTSESYFSFADEGIL